MNKTKLKKGMLATFCQPTTDPESRMKYKVHRKGRHATFSFHGNAVFLSKHRNFCNCFRRFRPVDIA